MSVPGEVLIADADGDVADGYAGWLSAAFDVRTAADADGALAAMDEDVSVVLLDRRIHERPGAVVLEVLREEYDCQVAFCSAVEPDLDIISVDIDEYLVKPVGEDELYAVVDTLQARAALAPAERSGLATRTKVELLRAYQPDARLAASTAFLDLQERTVQRGAE